MQETQTNNTEKRRGWVKNAIIIFLAVMLVLTFFSNSIMNISLPEVAAVYTTSGTVTNKINVTGNIEPNESYGVYSDGTYTLRTVKVRTGDVVETGTVLATYEYNVSEELKTAQRDLQKMQNDYDLAVLEADSSDNYQKLYHELDEYKKKANDAWAVYQVQADHYAIPAGDLSVQILTLEEEVKQLKSNVDAFKAGMVDYATLTEKIATLQAQKEKAIAEIEKAQEILDNPTAYPSAQVENARQTLEIYSGQVDRLVVEINLCYEKLNNLNSLVDADSTQEQILEMLEGSLESAQIKLDAYKKAAELYKTAKEADNAYEDKKYDIQEQVAGYNKTDKKNELTLKSLKNTLDAQKALVEELEAKGQSVDVVSPVSGTVTTIFFQAGEQVKGGSQLFAIELSGKGYILRTTMSSEQARQIRVGDKATAQDWWYGDLNATVSAIKNDPAKPGKSNIVEFVITGDVSAGQTMKLSVGSRSASYDILVPNSAIREDSNGKFILIVNSKSSPLGNRYYAKRVDVSVLASDEKYTAISGDIFGSEFVITTVSSPIESGSQVRLAE